MNNIVISILERREKFENTLQNVRLVSIETVQPNNASVVTFKNVTEGPGWKDFYNGGGQWGDKRD